MRELEDKVREALRKIILPKLDQNILDAGMVERIEVQDGQVRILLHFKPAYASKSQLVQQIKEGLNGLGISQLKVEFVGGRRRPEDEEHRRIQLPGVKEKIAIFSGKGGVGKSTISVNLAVALAQAGARIGLFDADVHGPNIPNLLGLDELPLVEGDKIKPIERYGLKTISLGLLVPPDEALIWRGPMISKAIRELLMGVDWGDLDFMVLDLPPSTGDAPLGLAQELGFSGAIAVTTPQEVSLADVRRGITMFKRLGVPILGLIENMSYFLCPHCGQRAEIFGQGGGEREARRQGLPLLGRIPLDPKIRQGGDEGIPIVILAPESPASQEFRRIAQKLLEKQRKEAT